MKSPDPSAMEHILVLQLKRIGDAVLTAPALAALRASRPGAKITLVLAGVCGQLAPAFSMVDEVLVWIPSRLNADILQRVAAGGWDEVYDFTGNDRSAFLTLLSRAARRVGYEKFAVNILRKRAWKDRCVAEVRDVHTIDFHHELARTLVPDLPFVADGGHLLSSLNCRTELPERYVVIHPGTAREEKFWLAKHWAVVTQQLIDEGMSVVFTGGNWKVEQTHLREITGMISKPVINLAGQLSLMELVGVIAASERVISVDTGAMHIAAAFARPQIALFGPTNPYHWAPRHARACVLLSGATDNANFQPRHPVARMSDIMPERVLQALSGF